MHELDQSRELKKLWNMMVTVIVYIDNQVGILRKLVVLISGTQTKTKTASLTEIY